MSDHRYPQKTPLWLGVSYKQIAVYIRGEREPQEIFTYEKYSPLYYFVIVTIYHTCPPCYSIQSFGTPYTNKYKIVVDNDTILFETEQVP